MTTARRIMTARSIAALDDQTSIETRPLQDIEADLTTLGIDPKASIMAARKLAGERSTPAQRLLARLDDGDAIALETEALEKADIVHVQAAVSGGTAASIAAAAKQRAGVPSNVTRLKRPGRRFWGWSGSMIGIAACLLLLVVTKQDQPYRLDSPVSEEADRASARNVKTFSDMAAVDETAPLSRTFEPPMEAEAYETRKSETADAIGQTVASAEPVQRTAQARLSVSEAETTLDNLSARERREQDDVVHQPEARPVVTARESSEERARSSDQENTIIAAAPSPTPQVSHRPKARPAPPPTDPGYDSVAALSDSVEPQKAAIKRGSAITAGVSAAYDSERLQAILIVDPGAAPSDLLAKAQALPKGDLMDRLDDANTLLGSKRVVALVTLLQDGEEVDAAITAKERWGLIQPPTALAYNALMQKGDDGFELIILPDRP